MISAIAVFSFGALADDDHGNGNNNSSFESGLIGSTPGVPIGGVNAGGAPWVVSRGEASVSGSGRIRVEVQGLLLSAGSSAGTTGPVTMVGATLVCGGTGGTPVAVPDAAVTPSPLNAAGNAEINQVVTLPAACLGPVVLVRIFNASAPLGSQLGSYIASSGLAPGAAPNMNENDSKGHGH